MLGTSVIVPSYNGFGSFAALIAEEELLWLRLGLWAKRRSGLKAKHASDAMYSMIHKIPGTLINIQV